MTKFTKTFSPPLWRCPLRSPCIAYAWGGGPWVVGPGAAALGRAGDTRFDMSFSGRAPAPAAAPVTAGATALRLRLPRLWRLCGYPGAWGGYPVPAAAILAVIGRLWCPMMARRLVVRRLRRP